ncbi:probable low conductance mechanosensitive channel YnaI at C-terminar half [Coccomyxa sp. Obi]|nr:probable low conductance mechanosensitive channel YnaI at C-terminar half [Coccomyxa sp. Obi]
MFNAVQQPAVHSAFGQCALAIITSFVAASLLSALLEKAANKELMHMSTVDDDDETVPAKPKPVMLQIFETTVFAVKKPLKVALSLVAGVFSLRFFAAFLQIVLEVHAEHEHIAPGWLVEGLGKAMAGLDHVGLLVLEFTEVAMIIFGVWVVLRMKEHMVSKVLKQRLQTDTGSSLQQAAFEQVLLPLSGMGSWIVVVSGGLMSMHVLGINLAPLLTVGGISGIVVGLSAQALLGNMISGLNLYLSRPFVVGEKIDVMTSSGGKVVSGFVEEVSPMRTHLRTDHWLSVMVPNKVLSELIISNESRIQESKNVQYYNKMRVFHFTACIRYQDFDKLEGILKDYKTFLEASDSIDMSLPLHAHLAGFDEEGLKIAVHVHSRPSASRHYSAFKQEMLLNLGKIVKAHGADFAWKDHIEFTSGPQALGNGNGSAALEVGSLAAS